jgi:hypothetical protein
MIPNCKNRKGPTQTCASQHLARDANHHPERALRTRLSFVDALASLVAVVASHRTRTADGRKTYLASPA